jgi:hypothetical protein
MGARTQKATQEMPRFQLSEMGYNGLKISAGIIHEEMKRELQFPASIITYKQMSYDSVIAAALNYYEHMMLKAGFKFKPHPLATDEQKEYATFMQDCTEDMDHSWQDFIQEVSSMNVYGFCANEIVLRKRLLAKGSKYNDGKIGIHKLPIRSQDSISSWNYDDDQNLVGLTQTIAKVGKQGRVLLSAKGDKITLPRNKFLLFRLGKKKDSPVGDSPLKGCFYSWKYKTSVEELESVGMQRDLSGVPIAWIPPQIMADDAEPSHKAQYELWQNIVRNTHNNQQAGMVLPLMYDEITKQPLFKFELLKNDGGKAYDTKSIKEYYCNAMLTALSADILLMGQSSTGSYALGSIKGTLSAIAIESKLKEICNVVNQHLIPLLGRLNGWEATRLPSLTVEDLEAVSLEEISKFVQRIGSVGYLPRTREVVNKVLDGLGLEPLAEDVELDDVLQPSVSRASDGMETPLDGTRKKQGDGTDTSAKNLDNKG